MLDKRKKRHHRDQGIKVMRIRCLKSNFNLQPTLAFNSAYKNHCLLNSLIYGLQNMRKRDRKNG